MSISSPSSSTGSASSAGSTTDTSESGVSSATPTSNTDLGETQFMQLFMAELQNQDPSSPMDDTQMASQLAQFTSVEQMTDVNTNLQSLMTGQASQSQVQDASMIGDQVLYSSSSLNLTQGQSTTIDASFASAPAKVTVTITNAAGQAVRSFSEDGLPAGQNQIPWNGEDDAGNPLPSGTYNVNVTAVDSSGNTINVTQEVSGTVTGVDFTNGYPQLVVNGTDIDMSTVSQINGPPAASSSSGNNNSTSDPTGLSGSSSGSGSDSGVLDSLI